MLAIETVESIEGLVLAETRAVKSADARVKDWQRQTAAGDCFWIVESDGLEIFGEVLSDYSAIPHRRNFRECRCYSAVCPKGEIGDIHVATMNARMRRGDFELIKKLFGMAVSNGYL